MVEVVVKAQLLVQVELLVKEIQVVQVLTHLVLEGLVVEVEVQVHLEEMHHLVLEVLVE